MPDADRINRQDLITLWVQFTQGPYQLLGRLLDLPIGNLAHFVVSGQCVATPDWDDNMLLFRFRPGLGNAHIGFTRPGTRGQIQAQNGLAYLALDGAARGCFRFDVALGGKTAPFDYRTVVEYFSPGTEAITALRYPLVDATYGQNMVFQASVDPLHLTSQGNGAPRTFFAFPPGTRIATTLRTPAGHPVFLEPAGHYLPNETGHPYLLPTEDTGLVVFLAQDADRAAVTWQGDFHIGLTGDADQPAQLLCGLSGLETIAFQPKTAGYEGDILRFVPNQPGFAPDFPIALDAMRFDRQPLLCDDLRTTWVTLKPSQGRVGPIHYLSQPRGAPLFRKSDRSGFLELFPAISADLARAPVAFPLVPYGGIEASAASTAAAFEQHIITPARRQAIDQVEVPYENALLQAGELFTKGARISATTPDGLYAEVSENTGAWTRLVLAINDDAKTKGLEFENLSPLLKSVFQAGEQFLVISINKPAGDSQQSPLGTFHNQVCIEGWPFTLNVATANQHANYSNVLIFKFCQGTVADRVKNPKLWTNQEAFNETADVGLLTLASWLSDYVQRGIDAAEQVGDPNYATFSRIVQDPSWNGILALRTDIDPKGFPPDLQGVLGGIDLSRFKAHHFGINVNRIATHPDGTLAAPATSSLFGLIDYIDREFEPFKEDADAYKRSVVVRRDVDCAFKVLTLKVLFENSKIKSFRSLIELTINTLFGERVTSPTNDNLLILTGSYEDHNGSPSYTFNRMGENTLLLANKVLTRVSVQKAIFSTVNQGAGIQTGRIESRFGLWGTMRFAELPGLDLFSFGSSAPPDDLPDPRAHAGLAYADLGITMSFMLNDSSSQVFAFDPSRVSFDIATSTPRPGSFYRHFPIKLTGLTYGTRDSLPASQGYLDVRVPDLAEAGTINGDWYGLVFDLNMGTLGTLAGAAGFNSSLMALWQVGTGRVAVAIKLPGVSPQSKFLNLQGIIKIDIDEIKLMVGETQADHGEKAYLMTINDIALQFFGAKIPPDDEIDFYLFGDPEPGASSSSLGWYAAYQK